MENAVFRYEAILGQRMRSRTLEGQRREVQLAARILNTMTGLGMPDLVKAECLTHTEASPDPVVSEGLANLADAPVAARAPIRLKVATATLETHPRPCMGEFSVSPSPFST